MTNLYVGNLMPEVNELKLAKVFSKYGEIESIKILWPRHKEEYKRKRNSGFVKYATYEAACLVKMELNEKQIKG